jgi:cytochrome c oxidase subunit 2
MNELLRQLLFLPPQRSTVAQDIDSLHYFVILVTMAGATLVTLVGAVFSIRYRRRTKDTIASHPDAGVQIPMVIEVIAVVGLFALFLLWWAIGSRKFVNLRVPPENAMEIYVTAKQWMWKFAYPQGNNAITTLYVPTRRPVKLLMTSRDVIHSFYVPDFRIKQDVLPGRYTTVWFEAKDPGSYQILCTEYCGTGHSTMRGYVIALDEGDFERWLGGEDFAKAIAGPVYIPPVSPGESAPKEMLSLVRMGERAAAEQGCLRCHTTDGSSHIGPTWAALYGSVIPLEGGGEARVEEAYITESMMDPAVKIHRGFQPVMPSYQGRISAPETAAIIEFIRSLRETHPEGPGGAIGGPIFGPIPPLPDGGSPAPISGPRGERKRLGPPAPAAPPGGAADGGQVP